MQSVYDVDVILLLATKLAAKRRPGTLTEIVAATELVQGLQGTLPAAAKLRAAFSRLATHGLVEPVGEGFALTASALAIVAGITRNATTAQQLGDIRAKLAASAVSDGHADIQIADEQWDAAIAAHRAAAAGAGKNQLVPKPKAADDERKRPGKGPGQRQRKPLPPRGKKR